jgi:UDP-N-acetylmuramate dehydrogenase
VSSARVPEFAALVRRAIRGEVKEAERLARYSTYRIGGPATLVLPAVPEDVGTVLALAHGHGVPWFALGLGSNVLLPDEGLDAVVVRLGKGLDRMEAKDERWQLGAGLPAPLAARRTAEAGWAGLHLMIGVPGTVGGGVYMNAGCHGGQWSDVVESVTAVNDRGESRVFARAEIPFGYRTSDLDGWVVLETTVRLTPRPSVELASEVARLLAWRQRGTPFNQPCCGSVFKNPTGVAADRRTAGQLIEAAGLKGHRVGGVEVSPQHGNYFVNTGGATASEVRRLMDEVQEAVRARFGVELEPEVKIIGAHGG